MNKIKKKEGVVAESERKRISPAKIERLLPRKRECASLPNNYYGKK